jgi:hypothetical protein
MCALKGNETLNAGKKIESEEEMHRNLTYVRTGKSNPLRVENPLWFLN